MCRCVGYAAQTRSLSHHSGMKESCASCTTARRRRARPWWLLFTALDLMSTLVGCRRAEPPRKSSWISEGGELGARVRKGELAGVRHHAFQSKLLGRDVGVLVATPPRYDQKRADPYPAVYIFPGISGDEWSYVLSGGLEGSAVRSLFADEARAPILVFGNPGDSGADGTAERVLAEELVAFVDAHYHTRKQAAGRSLEGFSLGGVTALALLTRHPRVFSRAVAASSACYLLPNCEAIRKSLRAHAKDPGVGPVLLSIGEREGRDNRAVNDELAPLFGVSVRELPGADHDYTVQLATRVGGRPFGEHVAAFHLQGF